MKEAAAPPPKTPAELTTGSPSASRPIRRRTGSSSSSASSLSSAIPSSSPSPAHRYLFPLRSSSAVPFSWEHLPGVPKNPKSFPSPAVPHRLLLPLPPPLRSKPDTSIPRKKRSDARFSNLAPADPFAAALAECTKDDPAGTGLAKLWGEPPAGAPRRRALATAAITHRFGLFDLYGSCKISCSVADAIIHVPRPGPRPAAYGFLNRRSSS
ncbi:uncharacterized protein LOC103708144 [Phoenix dactylifera]|uniref:Uncharacterized protein LOC103708144 n=1 Tax=Phoenix dactylifera TaxID=42345 RepID=A0A8B7C3U7_PHODC|nr:uncharacterized protein LOC103708144 [Phoenix dactylifera]